ncbi:bifunctional 5,10-methylenetetrahydrofolate dehydrogenase/5,10-methenyltetrahydrofolate cyclohydrolase [Streptomyces sp. NPDC049577]|uniref:bifunctional 5,10-methylenetetrahydrofolate dehydrogenase/5,10-methenyltetrahydrofolate cyclohydrolase n=1 Tax=Streptomyces sp. NPDC049577 TaxID=3155153 RepID=UPI00342454F5
MTSRQLSGTDLLRSVREDLSPYREPIEAMGKRVAIIRFLPTESDPPHWERRMEASRVSAEQKVRAFSHLGFGVDHVVLPGTTSAAEFAQRIEAFNADTSTSSVIVQFPPPAHLVRLVQHLDPAKDIDALLGDRSLQRACATADGISRIVAPFAEDARIAVVGARGFVGSGVVRLLNDQGLDVVPFDLGDDLREVTRADIVVSTAGNPHLLTAEHIRPHHRLVVDSGFTPQADGSVAGDIRPEAARVPQNITPVPGGVGPVEMAVLMERIVRKEANPDLKPWTFPPAPYMTRQMFAATMRSPGTAPGHLPRAMPAPRPEAARRDFGHAQGRGGSPSR